MTTIALDLVRAPRFPRIRTPFIVAFAAAALAAGLGRAVTTTYLPLLLERINDAPGLIGLVMLVNAAAGMSVPLVVGVWSDRRARGGRGRRIPFIVGGSAITAGGLLAIALGSTSSYLILALAAAVVYTGLNAVTTAHRSLIPESFDETGRARATSAQEVAMLVGGVLGLAVGGGLTGIAPWAPFALTALVVPLLALPTILRVREPDTATADDGPAGSGHAAGYYLRAASRPGVRGFLLAQILWVLGYAALPAFFLLYAEEELRLSAGIASAWLAGFGLATGAGMVAAGRVRNPRLHRPLLLVGIVLLGGGFLGVGSSTSLAPVGVALLIGAAGFGLVSTLGFPLFSKLIPENEAGGYTALYFSVRSISSTIALPAAGFTVQATGSYRSLFFLGGFATLAALVPLVGIPRVRIPRPRANVRWALALVATVPVFGLLVAQTEAHRADEWLYGTINGFGPGPELLWTTLDPHTRNYGILIVLALGAAAVTNLRRIPETFARVFGSALLAWILLEVVYSVYDRPRPEEVVSDATLNGHSWAHLNSFPSGHMAITAALAVAVALAFPRLRYGLWAYVAAVALTRVFFGAHFPLDVLAGTALGIASAVLVALAFSRFRSRSAVTAVEPMEDGDRVVAVMPSYDDVPQPALAQAVLEHVDELVLVDDGSSPAVAAQLDELADELGLTLVRLPERSGKGSAVLAGVDRVRADADAVLIVDADGQHSPSAIPAFLEASRSAELVIGDRFADLKRMPWHRQLANRITRRLFQLATGRKVRDTQNGMRLIRGRALATLPSGGYEAETAHLRRVLTDGHAVAWVPVPTIYGEERSSFRPIRDGARVWWALARPLAPHAQPHTRSRFRSAFPPRRRTRSELPGTPVTARRRRPSPATAA
jgi:membrane-associated phospholipid phosphatase/predicted MFS family arabinose efflux permease